MQEDQVDNKTNEAENGQNTESTFDNQDNVELASDVNPITWSASEFISHDKPKSWFVILGVSILAVTVGVFLLSRSIFSAIIILILGIIFAVVAGRQPRTLQYTLNKDGVTLETKFHPYSEFKSFSVYDEGGINSIKLNSLRRFSPSTNIYYETADEPEIIKFLGNYLPNELASKDPIDQLMRKIKY